MFEGVLKVITNLKTSFVGLSVLHSILKTQAGEELGKVREFYIFGNFREFAETVFIVREFF